MGLNTKTFNRWKLLLTKPPPGHSPLSASLVKPTPLIPVRLARPELSDSSLGCTPDIRIRLDDGQWVVDVPFGVDARHLAKVLNAIAGAAQ